jgi:hypothetical protein
MAWINKWKTTLNVKSFLRRCAWRRKWTSTIQKDYLPRMNAWRNKSSPLNHLGENLWRRNQRRTCSEVELHWGKCLVKQKNPQLSQSKTSSSTLDTPNVSNMKDKENIQPNILQGLGTMNVNLPFSQARIEITNNHADNGLLAGDLPRLKETHPLFDKQVDEIPMKIIF